MIAVAILVLWAASVDRRALETPEDSGHSAESVDHDRPQDPVSGSVGVTTGAQDPVAVPRNVPPSESSATDDPYAVRVQESIALDDEGRLAAVRRLRQSEDPAVAYDLALRFYEVDPSPAFYEYQEVLLAAFREDWEFLTTVAQDDFLHATPFSQGLLGLSLLRASYYEEPEMAVEFYPLLEHVYHASEDVTLRMQLALNAAAVPGLESNASNLLEDLVRTSDSLPTSQLGHVLPDLIDRAGLEGDETFSLYRELALRARSPHEIDSLIALWKQCGAPAGLRILENTLPPQLQEDRRRVREAIEELADASESDR